MVFLFLSHTWKKFSRSVSFGKEMATSFFLAFLAMMMVSYSIALGFMLDRIITKTLHVEDSTTFLNGMLLYYFGFEFMMRYFLQNLPVLDIQPYLHLPIKKSGIVQYLLGKSLLHVMNFMVFFLFAPFAFQAIATTEGTSAAWSWLLALWLLSLTLHYLVILFKKQLDDSIWGLIALVSIIGLFGAADYFGWFRLSDISAPVFVIFIKQPFSLVIPLVLFIGIYFICFRFFRQSMYIEDIASQKNESYGVTKDLTFLSGLGTTGDWINMEVKLILRNKRPRNILFLSVFFLFYGLIFYTNKKYTEEMPAFLLFVGIFITGIFTINYGQFLYSWQGGHLDFTLTQPVSMHELVTSKYWLLSAITIVCFLLSIPYVYFGWNILLAHLAAAFFNLGINIFIILNMAMWEPKKIDLKKGAAFNYQGIGAAQWLMGFPILLGPYIVYVPFSLMGNTTTGLIAVGVAGLAGIAFRKQLLTITTRRLIEKKYSMAASFRKE